MNHFGPVGMGAFPPWLFPGHWRVSGLPGLEAAGGSCWDGHRNTS